MNPRARIAFGLAALFAANSSAVAIAMWIAYPRSRFTNWASPAAGGLLMGIIMTLAIWLTFGDGRWYLRLVTCFVAVLAMAFGTTWLEQWHANRTPFNERDAWTNMLMMLLMLLVGFTAMWPWRRLRGLRLTWADEVNGGLPANQFQSRDLLFWTFAIAGVLAALRALAAIVPFGSDWGRQIVILVAVLILPLAATHAAFARSRTFRPATALLTLTFLIAGSFVAFDYLQRLQAASVGPPRLVMWPRLADSVTEAIPYVALTSLVLLNCLALRALGCRLVQRSGDHRSGELAADLHRWRGSGRR